MKSVYICLFTANSTRFRLCHQSYYSTSRFCAKKAESDPKTKAEKKEARKKRKLENDGSEVFTEEYLNLTSYYGENGYRKVYPFMNVYTMKAKKHWFGRTVQDVFLNAFKIEPDALNAQLREGRINMDGYLPSMDRKIHPHDTINVSYHRHEAPVLNKAIEILEDTDDLLVINKPASIPMYPRGRYHFNTVSHILAKEHGYRTLRPLHRIDRKASGVVIFTKSQSMIARLQESWHNNDKIYLCRVNGEFPGGPVECRAPLAKLSAKLGLTIVSEEGKEARSVFERLSYNGSTSLVKCQIFTGRTHQIRVHLQYLGYPIVYDEVYDSDAWGPERGRGGKYHMSGKQLEASVYNAMRNDCKEIPVTKFSEQNHNETELPPYDPDKVTFDPLCPYCTKKRSLLESVHFFCLHHLRCTGEGFDYSAPLPPWARDDWQS